MSEALDRVMEALAGVSDDEAAAALAAVGTFGPSPASRYIVTEVEWV